MTNDVWYLTRDQVRALDAHAMTVYSMPGVILMENAGRGAAELITPLNPERLPVLIVCGAGYNGGDGLVIARHLQLHGMTVNVILLADHARRSPKLSDDARINYEIALAGEIPITQIAPEKPGDWQEAFTEATTQAGLIVDALFGTGLTRPVEGIFAEVIQIINQANKQIIAIDVPSGLDANTGTPLGQAIRANHTITFVAPKTGFREESTSAYTGQIHTVPIGIPQKLLTELQSNIASTNT